MQPSPNPSTVVETQSPRSGTFLQAMRRIFSFPVVLAFLLIVLASITVHKRFEDPDMWWHLKMGQIIWTTHTIPMHDIFSYTTNHHATVPQEWLGEVTIYLAYKLGGLSGMMLWLCIFSSALLIAGYILCWLYSGNLKIALVGAGCVWLFSTVGLSIRPQLIGYLLLIVELILIHLGRTRNPRWFLVLPVLFALWINCHGSFFLGIVVAGVYLFSSFFHFQAGSLIAQRWDPRTRNMLAIALALSCAALFLNPDGIHQITYPLNTLFHQKLQMNAVQEWQPTRMSGQRGVVLLVLLLGSFLVVITRRSELYWDELLILIAATWLGVSHSRTLFAFGILIAPIVSRLFSGFWENYDPTKDPRWLNAIVMAGAIAIAFFAFPSKQALRKDVEEKCPVKAVDFIKQNHLQGPMLNDYIYGGYLIWAAPEYPDFVDGRADLFEWTGVLREFGEWAILQADPNHLLQKYKVNFCLLTAQSPMVYVLSLLPNWKKIYSDDNSVIFLRRSAGGS